MTAIFSPVFSHMGREEVFPFLQRKDKARPTFTATIAILTPANGANSNILMQQKSLNLTELPTLQLKTNCSDLKTNLCPILKSRKTNELF